LTLSRHGGKIEKGFQIGGGKMRGSYQTKQRKQILEYLAGHPGQSVPAKEIHAVCQQNGTPISLAIIYRQLEHLMQESKIKKVVTSDGAGIQSQYVAEAAALDAFYLKCDRCGKLAQMDCGLLHEVADHMGTEHGFLINAAKSVLYGRCRSCKP